MSARFSSWSEAPPSPFAMTQAAHVGGPSHTADGGSAPSTAFPASRWTTLPTPPMRKTSPYRHRRSPPLPTTAATRVDPRQLQTRALAQWERQKAIWQRTSHSLQRRTHRSGDGGGDDRVGLLPFASSHSRILTEDFNMVSCSVPLATLSQQASWEAMLHCDDPTKAMRSVQIGRGYFPYPLFGEVQDPAALREEHPIYTRVIYPADQSVETTDMQTRTTARALLREELEREAEEKEKEKDGGRSISKGGGGGLSRPRPTADGGGGEDALDRRATRRRMTRGDGKEVNVTEEYYYTRIHSLSGYIQQKFSHFFLPREFLEVRGGKIAALSKEAFEEVQRREAANPPSPTTFFPAPPPLALPQQVRLSIRSSSVTSESGPHPTHHGAASSSPAGSLSAIHTRSSSLSPPLSVASPLVSFASPLSTPAASPSLVLSAKRLLFRALPGEIAHGAVALTNPSPVTVYYTWIPVDPIEEGLQLAAVPHLHLPSPLPPRSSSKRAPPPAPSSSQDGDRHGSPSTIGSSSRGYSQESRSTTIFPTTTGGSEQRREVEELTHGGGGEAEEEGRRRGPPKALTRKEMSGHPTAGVSSGGSPSMPPAPLLGALVSAAAATASASSFSSTSAAIPGTRTSGETGPKQPPPPHHTLKKKKKTHVVPPLSGVSTTVEGAASGAHRLPPALSSPPDPPPAVVAAASSVSRPRDQRKEEAIQEGKDDGAEGKSRLGPAALLSVTLAGDGGGGGGGPEVADTSAATLPFSSSSLSFGAGAPSPPLTSPSRPMFASATPEMLRCSQLLHQMATSVQQARHFFHLSFPMNGVLLPEEKCIFPFSLRAPHAGTFQQVYELLTVPQSATRILIDLHAIVSPAFPSVEAQIAPLEAVLPQKVSHAAQRELIQSIARSTDPFVASDLQHEKHAIEDAMTEEARRTVVRQAEEKERWERCNTLNFDALPYHPLVYSHLSMLFEQLTTYLKETEVEVVEGGIDGGGVGWKTKTKKSSDFCRAPWNGSLSLLWGGLAKVRDGSSRVLLQEGVEVLLRVARVVGAPPLGATPPHAEEGGDRAAKSGSGVVVEIRSPLADGPLPSPEKSAVRGGGGKAGEEGIKGENGEKRRGTAAAGADVYRLDAMGDEEEEEEEAYQRKQSQAEEARARRIREDQQASMETLVRRAAAELAEQYRTRALAQLKREVEFSQYPREVAPSALPPTGKTKKGGGGGGAAGGGGGAAALGSTMSGGGPGGGGGGGSGRRGGGGSTRDGVGSAGSAADAHPSSVSFGPSTRPFTRAEAMTTYPSMPMLPSGGLAVTGGYRQPPAPTPEEHPLFFQEYELLLAQQTQWLDERLAGFTERLYERFQKAIEQACYLPLLGVTQRSREDDLHVIQNLTEMEVDAGGDNLVSGTGKASGKKK